MPRILHILRLFWTTSLHAELEYRLNFFMSALTAIANFAGSLFTLSLLFSGSHTGLGGWTWNQALIITGMFTMLDGVSGVILNPNLSRIVQYVQRGTLDFILLKPLNSQLWLSLRNASPWGFPSLFFGLTLVIYAGMREHVSPLFFLLGLLTFALSIVILYSLWFVLGATTIWFTKIFNVTEVLRSLTAASQYPMAIYPPVYRFVFMFILPVAFLTTIPAELMLGKSPLLWIALEAALALLLFAFSSAFWRFALRSYTSAGG